MNLFDRFVTTTLPLVPKPLVRMVSTPYLAGETVPEMIEVVRRLNSEGCTATVSVLGEHVTSREEAEGAVREFVEVLDALEANRLQSGISIKPTQLGLKIDRGFCEEMLRKVLEAAARHGAFVRIDMEDSSCTDATLDLYRSVRRDFPRVGAVLQAYLRRSVADALRLAGEQADVRVCKGIYREPRRVAYQEREIVRKNFLRVVEVLIEGGSKVGLATHDEWLVWEGLRLAETHGLGTDAFEFQMLLGVDDELRRILVEAGHPVRVYVPFGPRWYPYSVRRLRENPQIARYVMVATLRGR